MPATRFDEIAFFKRGTIENFSTFAPSSIDGQYNAIPA
jgi:hypothetical protein